MRIAPHLCFDGQCEAAFTFYQEVFGGELATLKRYGDTPMGQSVPDDWQTRIAHATLVWPGYELLGADVLPEQFQAPQGFIIAVGVEEPAKARDLFDALAFGATIITPFESTFWTAGYGMLVDQFGIPWEINCEEPVEPIPESK